VVAIIVNDSPLPLLTRFCCRCADVPASPNERTIEAEWKCGQVAQVVERSPEKAGVGGSTPSLATIISNFPSA
jgi:hypothetical protein